MKLIAGALITAVLLAGCGDNSSPSYKPITVNELPSKVEKPYCNTKISIGFNSSLISKNPSLYAGQCGLVQIEVIEAFNPSDCEIYASYDSDNSLNELQFPPEAYFHFWDCDNRKWIYKNERYYVTMYLPQVLETFNNIPVFQIIGSEWFK